MTAEPTLDENGPRPEGCCGECPAIVGGGYDCTCSTNPRCELGRERIRDLMLEVGTQHPLLHLAADLDFMRQHWEKPYARPFTADERQAEHRIQKTLESWKRPHRFAPQVSIKPDFLVASEQLIEDLRFLARVYPLAPANSPEMVLELLNALEITIAERDEARTVLKAESTHRDGQPCRTCDHMLALDIEQVYDENAALRQQVAALQTANAQPKIGDEA